MTDIEISEKCEMLKITDILNNIGIADYNLYGDYIAKINSVKASKKGKLILVTAVNPTKYGEGKTTVSIGLADGLKYNGEKALLVLREPSLGPVFGIKGGATGGGYSQVNPMTDINLHFTGDFHAISSANNLLVSAVYNHIYFGNQLGIEEVSIKRCMDVNDRDLRDKFDITAASEVMSVFCLADDLSDLERRLGNIIVGYRSDKTAVYAKDLRVEGAMTVLLKEAFKPNLVQSLEHTPAIIHGGPFANISLGISSVSSIKMGIGLADYVITEAGFGADLGCEKFLNILSQTKNIVPDAVVLVTTTKVPLENLEVHILNLKKIGVNFVVCLNKHADDSFESVSKFKDFVNGFDVPFEVSTAYLDGGKGCSSLAKTIVDLANKPFNLKPIYYLDDPVSLKIEKIAKEIYHAGKVNYSDKALNILKELDSKSIKYPVCIAKTQYSISDDKDKLGFPKDYEITVREIEVKNGSEIIVVKLNNIMTMPGLPKVPNYESIKIDNEKIVGIF